MIVFVLPYGYAAAKVEATKPKSTSTRNISMRQLKTEHQYLTVRCI